MNNAVAYLMMLSAAQTIWHQTVHWQVMTPRKHVEDRSHGIQPWHFPTGIVKTALKKDRIAHLWGKI